MTHPQRRKKTTVRAKDIASHLGGELLGKNIFVVEVKALDEATSHSLSFSKRDLNDTDLKHVRDACVIVPKPPRKKSGNTFIVTDNPRLAFAKAVRRFFLPKDNRPPVGEYTCIDPSARIGKQVTIGNSCTIGARATIGDFTEIRNNVVISEGVQVGRHCLIKSGTVIGEKGFGFDFEKDNTPYQIPHLGSVLIGDHVEIGALNTVVRGTVKHTIVGAHVKTDDHVHIAHNCTIGEKTLITACAEISGSTRIGKECWLGPNCSVMNNITIGDRCMIGLGAVVRKDAPAGSVLAGNPARVIRKKK